jgi:hypothetical protein
MGTEKNAAWEYLVVECSYSHVKMVNGKEPEQVETERNTALFGTKIEKIIADPLLYEYLQKQGREGWEVCSSSLSNTSSSGYIVILKRSLE